MKIAFLKTNELTIKYRLRSTVFFLAGCVLLLLSWIANIHDLNLLHSILLNLAIVFISIVLVDLLWTSSGGSPIDNKLNDVTIRLASLATTLDSIEAKGTTGLDKTYTSAGNYGNQEDWINLISNAKNNVDIMGRTMEGWSNADLTSLIKQKCTIDNVNFRWIIMSEDNRYLPYLEEEDFGALLPEKIKKMKLIFRNTQDALPSSHKENFQTREFLNVPLHCSIMRIDEKVYVAQYLSTLSSKNSPFFSITGPSTGWWTAYSREFDEIWKSARSIA